MPLETDSGDERLRAKLRIAFQVTFLLMLATGIPIAAWAQGLDETFVPAVGLPEAWNGAMLAWDYDDDGDPDILLSGLDRNGDPRTWLLRYDGVVTEPVANGPDRQKATFTPRSINIPPFLRGTIDHMPPDAQGIERMLFTGLTPLETSTDIVELIPLSIVYNRIDSTSFAPAAHQPFVGVHESFTAWADVDDDGDEDLVLGGETLDGPFTALYINTNGSFSREEGISLPGMGNADASWGDLDGDGDPDLVLAGQAGATSVFRLYENSGRGLMEISSPESPVLFHARAALRDIDGDGKAELLYMGGRLDPLLMRPEGILWNSQSAAGREFGSPAAFPGLAMARLFWSDLEGDGDLDLVAAGYDEPASPFGQRLRIFVNAGGTLVPVEDFRGGIGLGLVWADFNDDGRRDILLIGRQPDAWVRNLILL